MKHQSLAQYRDDFPIFKQNKDLCYLDSAATSQKPNVVIEAIDRYYRSQNANVHRGIYHLSEQATEAYEQARCKAQGFIGARHAHELVFTKGTTESINLVASSWCDANLKAGDEIVLSVAEHHANIVPWQMAAKKAGATVKYIELTHDYRLDLDHAASLISEKTKLVAIAHVSNVLGVIHPIKDLIALARKVGAKVLIDGAQGAVHLPVDVKALDCDFYAFGGHKVLGPTGIGILYAKEEILEKMPPYQFGGDMIETVTTEGSTWAELPNKFEAGTPNIAGAVGLGVALDYLSQLPRKHLLEHERRLGTRCLEALESEGAKVFAKPGDDWVGIVSFSHPKMHPHDIASVCASDGVCVRAGHHCAQPLMKVLGVGASSRVSPFLYNNDDDIDRFIKSFKKARDLFT